MSCKTLLVLLLLILFSKSIDVDMRAQLLVYFISTCRTAMIESTESMAEC